MLVDRWLKDGTLRPATRNGRRPASCSFSSEAHRSAEPIDFDHFGAFENYGLRDGLKHYGASKLVLSTFAVEHSRRLTQDGGEHVAVHSLCPGPRILCHCPERPGTPQPLIYP